MWRHYSLLGFGWSLSLPESLVHIIPGHTRCKHLLGTQQKIGGFLDGFLDQLWITYGSPMDHLWINYGSFMDKPWIIYYGWFLGHWWMVDGCFMALYGMDFTWNWPCCQFGPERFIACPNKNPGTWTNHLWIPMGPWIYFASPSL